MCNENTATICNGISRLKKCRNEIVDNGVNNSGFCTSCWYPSIEVDYANFKDFKEEGYSRYEAGVMAGIFDPDEPVQSEIEISRINLHGKRRY